MNATLLLEQDTEANTVVKTHALEDFNLFVKNNVSNLTAKEKWHITKYKTSCLFLGMYIPRVKKRTDYLLTILRVLSAYFQYSNSKLQVSKISRSKIFFSLSSHQFHDVERLKRLLLSEIMTINSIELIREKGITIMVNPLEKTLKVKAVDAYGYSELAFSNFSIKDVLLVKIGKEEVERVIENSGEWDGKAIPGTISKVDYRFISGLHHVVNGEDSKKVLAYRYQKFARTIDRFIKYDIRHGIAWDELLNKSSYNMMV